jgi:hypothetical protein
VSVAVGRGNEEVGTLTDEVRPGQRFAAGDDNTPVTVLVYTSAEYPRSCPTPEYTRSRPVSRTKTDGIQSHVKTLNQLWVYY